MTGYRLGAERTQAVPSRVGDVQSVERLPVGQMHAMNAKTGSAACGYVGALHDFGPWHSGMLRYCPECKRSVPFNA
ncbi:MAG: hypothetical protein M3Z02_12785 [Actinomycetota bacterium]|nr:hypothetical protein [Actinomycetota bacterium]